MTTQRLSGLFPLSMSAPRAPRCSRTPGQQLLYAFSIARVTPGQANLFVAAIGYMLFGLPGAALSIVVIAAPAYLMIPLVHSFQLLRGNRRVLYSETRSPLAGPRSATWGPETSALEAMTGTPAHDRGVPDGIATRRADIVTS